MFDEVYIKECIEDFTGVFKYMLATDWSDTGTGTTCVGFNSMVALNEHKNMLTVRTEEQFRVYNLEEKRMSYLKTKGTIITRLTKTIKDYAESTKAMKKEMGIDSEEIEFRLGEVNRLRDAIDEYVYSVIQD